MKKRWYGDPTPVGQVYTPEIWARMTLACLYNNLGAASLMNWDFQNEIATAGQVVRTRRPIPVQVKRRENKENVVYEDLNADPVDVRLNQHLYVGFNLDDVDKTLSMKDLMAEFLTPQVITIAEAIDAMALAQAFRFYMNAAGRLGQLSGPTARSTILDAKKVMDINKVPLNGRYLWWNPASQVKVLDTDIFTSAQILADDGFAIREAEMGRKLGFTHFMSQAMPFGIPVEATPEAGVTVDGLHREHQDQITLDGTLNAATFRVGNWIRLDGEDIPHRILQVAGQVITIEPPLIRDLPAGAEVYIDARAATTISEATTFARGYIVVPTADEGKFRPMQAITLGPDSEPFVIRSIDTSVTPHRIILDRPVENIYAIGTTVNFFPAGDYNFAFNRDALAIVCRPLEAPEALGAVDYSIQNFNNMSIRCVKSYDGDSLKSRIIMDMLFGVAVTNPACGVLVCG